jgi:hypothetical protein
MQMGPVINYRLHVLHRTETKMRRADRRESTRRVPQERVWGYLNLQNL